MKLHGICTGEGTDDDRQAADRRIMRRRDWTLKGEPAETGGCPDPYGSRCGVGIDDADLQVWLQ